jgi:hypothetical protein
MSISGLDDEFQAIHSLKSIIDYYTIPDDGIVDEAKRRHDNLASNVDSQMIEEIRIRSTIYNNAE